MEQSTNREAAGKPGPIFMEHRWGQRKRCRARVYLSAGAGSSGTGHVRDVSSSGAYIETTLPLPMHARVMLNVRGNESATHEVDIAASVARVDNDGIGVEWYETPAGSICVILGCTTLCAALKVKTD
ncbi:MAG TPA: PilZ domain-containing protein [Steroidobacteraceae bacterium]|nr:PilZ domain-containing protein [Steroidobacteraceae bacterium]